MKTQVHIVAGSLRGRKLACVVSPNLRPTPQRVREAFFSVMGNAIPNRPFFDVFAGTGVVGMEAISRGAKSASFIERDFQLLGDIEKHIRHFSIQDRSRPIRADVYRWVERWQAPREPVNMFISPPFPDFTRNLEGLVNLVRQLQEKVAPESILILQGEHDAPLKELPRFEEWEDRRYGRNHLLLWERAEETAAASPDETADTPT